jgi:hypothetical protein
MVEIADEACVLGFRHLRLACKLLASRAGLLAVDGLGAGVHVLMESMAAQVSAESGGGGPAYFDTRPS